MFYCCPVEDGDLVRDFQRNAVGRKASDVGSKCTRLICTFNASNCESVSDRNMIQNCLRSKVKAREATFDQDSLIDYLLSIVKIHINQGRTGIVHEFLKYTSTEQGRRSFEKSTWYIADSAQC